MRHDTSFLLCNDMKTAAFYSIILGPQSITGAEKQGMSIVIYSMFACMVFCEFRFMQYNHISSRQ